MYFRIRSISLEISQGEKSTHIETWGILPRDNWPLPAAVCHGRTRQNSKLWKRRSGSKLHTQLCVREVEISNICRDREH